MLFDYLSLKGKEASRPGANLKDGPQEDGKQAEKEIGYRWCDVLYEDGTWKAEEGTQFKNEGLDAKTARCHSEGTGNTQR